MASRRTVFISHASGDRPVVGPIADLLRGAGVEVFFAPESIDFGLPWEDMIWKTLDEAQRVLVFWSARAAESEWVKREYTFALQKRCTVVPIPIDNTPLPTELARIQQLTSFRHLLKVALVLGVINEHTDAGAALGEYTRPAVYLYTGGIKEDGDRKLPFRTIVIGDSAEIERHRSAAREEAERQEAVQDLPTKSTERVFPLPAPATPTAVPAPPPPTTHGE